MAPRFSVLLATHNRCELLRLAILSVLAQTEEDFELLVVGDGCTDNSPSVIESFNDPRIRWFDLPKAPFFGYANRNVALKQATGEYLAYVADDDLIFPDHLALLAATVEKSGAEWAYSRPLWVTTDGIVVPFASNLRNPDELDVFLTVRNHIPATCVVYRRSCVEKYGYWPEEFPRGGDWKYWHRIIEGGNRINFDYCSTPSALHFNAIWKTTPDAQMPQVTAAREIAAKGSWWPDNLKVSIPTGVPEQKVFYELLGSEDYVEQLRRDVKLVVERLAWMQLDDTPDIQLKMREQIAKAGAELAQVNGNLAAVAADAARLRAESDSLRVIISHTMSKLEAAQTELDAIRASNSWRITAPLRAIWSLTADPAVERYTTFDVQPGGACNLEQVSVLGDEVTISGWAFLSRDARSAPSGPVLLRLDVDRSSRLVMAERIERPDVADYYKNDALKMSGFTAVVKRQAGMTVKVLQAFEGRLYECPGAFPVQ
jgi:glycosyltransferase involved in cell wall biosynthesis